MREHVRLGYAATEPGNQSDTQDRSITLATGSTTGRGLYVGMTRGRQTNHALVVTDTPDIGAARDVLERAISCDRADVPAIAQRQRLEVDSEASALLARLGRSRRPELPPEHEVGIEID